MVEVRRAVVADASELVRLRGLMLADMHGRVPEPGPWQHLAAQTLRRRLDDGSLAAFVVDRGTVDGDGSVLTADRGIAGDGDGSTLTPNRSAPVRDDLVRSGDHAGPAPGGLVACAVGVIETRLGDPTNPSGESGYVFNVATESGYRRRGYARACVARLLDWYRRRGIPVVDLRATPDGEALYRSLGFVSSATPVLRLDNRIR
ncbi:GNAT family N-acetyltransferase [Plantactinospora sonchi]|uniref:GNAT family N-acetyltransferase n=1 Tax=Plantactinospora sonchi TaxID=1544735 RepID=A0ABU7S3G7_9ACTN